MSKSTHRIPRRGTTMVAALVATLALAAAQQALSAAPALAMNDNGGQCADSPWSWIECEEENGGGGGGGSTGGGDPFEGWETDAEGNDPFEGWELDGQDEPQTWTSNDGSVTVTDEDALDVYERELVEGAREAQQEYEDAKLRAMLIANHDDPVVISDETGDEQYERELREAHINLRKDRIAAAKAAREKFDYERMRQDRLRQQRQNTGRRGGGRGHGAGRR